MVSCPVIHVTAPSRLHFGLLSFGDSGRRFGGAGAMIDRPCVELTVRCAERFQVLGRLSGRIEQFVACWLRRHQDLHLPNCEIRLLQSPTPHSGLGSGTQLGLSVALGLNALFGLPDPTPAELAQSVGRGLRSAVGTYGFFQGGLIAERGKDREPLAPLDCRVALPDHWRFVLVRPTSGQGLAGPAERQAFRRLPVPSAAESRALARQLRAHLIPAAVMGDFEQFSESLYQYGNQAGALFAPIQGGSYNGPELTRIVRRIRAAGVTGVGQSSWGPTVFALTSNQQQAQQLVSDLREQVEGPAVQIEVSAPNNTGAVVRRFPEAVSESRCV